MRLMDSWMYSPNFKKIAELKYLNEDKWMDFMYLNHGLNVRNLSLD